LAISTHHEHLNRHVKTWVVWHQGSPLFHEFEIQGPLCDFVSTFNISTKWHSIISTNWATNINKFITRTHTQPFYSSLDFVRDSPGELVPEVRKFLTNLT